jgi:hypothetical protein
LPAIGLIKKVDFFWKDFPFDLKVTYFPEGYMQLKRDELGLSPELTDLKRFARQHNIPYDRTANNKDIFYEEQGVRRFDAANRFFLVLIDLKNLEDSWKLKRNKKLLYEEINAFLDNNKNVDFEKLKISFNWQERTYTTYATVLFIIKE